MSNYIQDQNVEPRTRRVKAKGKGQGSHGGQGLLAWMNFVKNEESGTSGFPVRVNGLRYTVSATVTALGYGLFDVSVSITGAGDLHLTQKGLSSALAKDFLADFNRQWRHIIDPDEKIQEIEYIEERQRKKLEYNWVPSVAATSWSDTQPQQPQYPVTQYYAPQCVYEPDEEEDEYEEDDQPECWNDYGVYVPYYENSCTQQQNESRWGAILPWLVVAAIAALILFF